MIINWEEKFDKMFPSTDQMCSRDEAKKFIHSLVNRLDKLYFKSLPSIDDVLKQ